MREYIKRKPLSQKESRKIERDFATYQEENSSFRLQTLEPKFVFVRVESMKTGQTDSLDLSYRVKDNHSRVHFLEKDH